MSAVLPELERLLDDAAARHYPRRRAAQAVRWIGLAGAAAAVVLAIAVLRPGGTTDERPATRPPVAAPDDAIGNAYAILAANGPAPDPALWHELSLAANFEGRSTSVWRVADRDGGRRIVVASGFNPVARERLVCVYIADRHGAGAVCEEAAKLLATDRPWVLAIGTGPVVLVRNDVTRVWLERADGSERALTPRNNVAIGRGDNACFIRWRRADGSRGRAPVDRAPRARCG